MPRRQLGCGHTKSPYFAASPSNESKLKATQEQAELARLHAYIATRGATLPQGWTVEYRLRSKGKSAGLCDVYYVSPDGNTRLNSRAAVLRLLEDSRPSDLRRSRRRREAAQTVNGEAGVAPGPAAKRRKAAVTPLTSAAAPADVGGAGGAGSAQARLAAPDSGNNSVETAAQPTAALASSGAAGAPQLRDRRPKQQKGSAACTPPAAAFPLLRRRRRAAAPGGSASASPRHPKPAASPVSFELFQFDAAQASPAAAGGQSKGGLSKTPSRLAAAAPGAEQSEKAEAAAAMAAVLEPQPRRVSRFFGVVGEGAVADAPRLPTVASRAAGDASTDGFASSLAAKAGAAANGPAGQNRRGVRRLQPQPLPRGEPEGWVPPASPWGLIEEQLYADPWKILVACICLNKTTAQQVRSVMWELFTLIPTPEAALCVTEEAILVVIRPLGQFYRAGTVKRMSEEFLRVEWTRPSQLHGIGRYGEDAHAIFCLGRWRETEPLDKDLRRYVDWLRSTGGQGSSFRHDAQPAGAPRVPGLDDGAL